MLTYNISLINRTVFDYRVKICRIWKINIILFCKFNVKKKKQ